MSSYIELIIGPMFSGKTDKLIELIKLQTKKVLIVKYVGDDRYGAENTLTSKSGMSIKYTTNITIITRTDLANLPPGFDQIFIDEGQFFPDLYDYCISAKKKHIYISALNGDYKQSLFGEIYKLLPKCDKITHLTSRCSICGQSAPFTFKIDQNECIVDIGGDDKYEARCRACLE